MMQPSSSPRAGDTLELCVEKLVPGGQGLARQDGVVFFIDNALPDQKLLVEVTSMKKRHGQAVIREVLQQTPEYVDPACPDFGQCGGCSWQHLSYERQLYWKEQFVRESLQRIGKIQMDSLQFRPIIASPKTWFYRSKMEFAFGSAPAHSPVKRPLLGLKMRSSNALVEVEDCRLQSQRAMELLAAIRSYPSLCEAPAYNARNGLGFWRYLVVRDNGQEVVAQLITTSQKQYTASVESLATELMRQFPWLTGLVHAYRDDEQQVALAEQTARVFGKERLDFTLGATRYSISSDGFFQPNAEAAHLLYDAADALAEIKSTDVIWDLYCGAGGVGLHLAPRAAQLVGFDISREALADAADNARLNNIARARFHPGDMRRSLRRENTQPDVLLTDPPRAGMTPEVLEQIIALKPKRILSIGCDPATQARDIGKLSQAYDVRAVQPVDMFPHTPHVENIVLLTSRDS